VLDSASASAGYTALINGSDGDLSDPQALAEPGQHGRRATVTIRSLRAVPNADHLAKWRPEDPSIFRMANPSMPN
jgi:hypothetical protein